MFNSRQKSKSLILFVPIFSLIFISEILEEKRFAQIFFPNGFSVRAELAVTDEERQLGLMFRKKIFPDQGMLFVFEEQGYHSFWMRNVNFPLDILWLDEGKRIVHMECNVPPCKQTPCPSYSPHLPATYVLELKVGSVDENGLKLYDRLEFILPDRVIN